MQIIIQMINVLICMLRDVREREQERQRDRESDRETEREREREREREHLNKFCKAKYFIIC